MRRGGGGGFVLPGRGDSTYLPFKEHLGLFAALTHTGDAIIMHHCLEVWCLWVPLDSNRRALHNATITQLIVAPHLQL